MEASQYSLLIVSPDQVLYEDDVVKTIVPGIHQTLAILPDHTPLYAQLRPGDVVITSVSGDQITIPIEGGIIRVKKNRVSIIIGFDIKVRSTN